LGVSLFAWKGKVAAERSGEGGVFSIPEKDHRQISIKEKTNSNPRKNAEKRS